MKKKIVYTFVAIVIAIVAFLLVVTIVKQNSELSRYRDMYGESDLKECPFCGSEVRFEQSRDDYHIECDKCGTSFYFNRWIKTSKEQASKIWNKRECD